MGSRKEKDAFEPIWWLWRCVMMRVGVRILLPEHRNFRLFCWKKYGKDNEIFEALKIISTLWLYLKHIGAWNDAIKIFWKTVNENFHKSITTVFYFEKMTQFSQLRNFSILLYLSTEFVEDFFLDLMRQFVFSTCRFLMSLKMNSFMTINFCSDVAQKSLSFRLFQNLWFNLSCSIYSSNARICGFALFYRFLPFYTHFPGFLSCHA